MFPHRTLLRAATPEQLLGAAQPDRGLRHLVARGLRTLALALARAARGVAPARSRASTAGCPRPPTCRSWSTTARPGPPREPSM